MVEAHDASAVSAWPADEPEQKYLTLESLQHIILESLSLRSEVLRDLRERIAREGGEFPEELLATWSCSIVTIKAELEAADDNTLVKNLEAVSYTHLTLPTILLV